MLPLRSVDTPVAKRPFDATAREPPRSTGWMFSCFDLDQGEYGGDWHTHASDRAAMEDPETILVGFQLMFGVVWLRMYDAERTVCSLRISSSKLTTPGRAAVTRSLGIGQRQVRDSVIKLRMVS